MFGSIKEINSKPKTVGNVFSTFSGCGGSSLGYKRAGYNVLGCLEFIDSAVETYKANHPTTKIIHDDIRNVSGEQILNLIGLQKGELDILDGSPPCSAFSVCGIRDKGWGKVKTYSDKKQRVDDLFFEYVRIANELRPKVAMAENVIGLTQASSKSVLVDILQSFRDIGYTANYQILNGADYGAPQLRRRLIFVFIRNDVAPKKFYYPIPTHQGHWITVNDVIADVENDAEELKMLLDAEEYYITYKLWHELAIGKSHKVRFNLVRNNLYAPSYTLVANNSVISSAGLCHPLEKRRHTIAECKRLMGFPDDYVLTGTWNQQIERLGRSVNPQVIEAVAKEVYYQVLNKQAKREELPKLSNYFEL